MPRKYTPKPFDPKPLTPGAAIRWSHTTVDGATTYRTGIVWSLAPLQRSGANAVWVTPDEPEPGDLHYCIYVGKRRGNGELFSSDNPYVETGGHTDNARFSAQRNRAMRSEHAA